MPRWRAVVRFKGLYQVSSSGDVRSLSRKARVCHGAFRIIKSRILQPGISAGYDRVILRKDLKSHARDVHVLVCRAFHGPKPTPLHEVNHKDGNKRNNHYTNLEIVTSLENIKHAATLGLLATGRAHGRHTCPSSVKRGSANGLAKLTESDVAKIREITTHRNGRILARQFDVSPSAISLIRRGKSWKHVR